jgi:hypothetical protein
MDLSHLTCDYVPPTEHADCDGNFPDKVEVNNATCTRVSQNVCWNNKTNTCLQKYTCEKRCALPAGNFKFKAYFDKSPDTQLRLVVNDCSISPKYNTYKQAEKRDDIGGNYMFDCGEMGCVYSDDNFIR